MLTLNGGPDVHLLPSGLMVRALVQEASRYQDPGLFPPNALCTKLHSLLLAPWIVYSFYAWTVIGSVLLGKVEEDPSQHSP